MENRPKATNTLHSDNVRFPIGELLGFRPVSRESGRAVVQLTAGPQHANPMGTLHGGVLCDIADAAMGVAFSSVLDPAESFTTVEFKINFFRPVWNGELFAEAHIVQRGKTVGYLECAVKDDTGRLIAKASSTCIVLRGEKATGR